MTEADFLQALRRLPLHPGARGLLDDAATLGAHVLTTDTLVEGVHFLALDPPADIAWKLVAVSLSDLAAKGARPEAILLNHPLTTTAWDEAFLAGLAEVLNTYAVPLIGGDTVSLPPNAPRVLTVTAIGTDAIAPCRTGAKAGDALWVTGTIGDAGIGLALETGRLSPHPLAPGRAAALLTAYRRPVPRLTEGRALGPLVHAMADVSDGLLIDAARMAAASGLAVTIELLRVPLSDAFEWYPGHGLPELLAAATAGDDYELLFALPAGEEPPVPATRVGTFAAGTGLTLTHDGAPIPLPLRLGFEHGEAERLALPRRGP